MSGGGAESSVLRSHSHSAPRCSLLRHLRHVLQPGQEHTALRSVPVCVCLVKHKTFPFYLKKKLCVCVGISESTYTPLANFTCGVGAGVLASLLTQPADVVKTHMQVNPQRFRRSADTLTYIYRVTPPPTPHLHPTPYLSPLACVSAAIRGNVMGKPDTTRHARLYLHTHTHSIKLIVRFVHASPLCHAAVAENELSTPSLTGRRLTA